MYIKKDVYLPIVLRNKISLQNRKETQNCKKFLLCARLVRHTQLGEFNGREQSHKLFNARATHSFTELLVAMQLIRAN